MDYDEIIEELELLIKGEKTENSIEALEEAIKIIEDVKTL